MLLLLFSLVLCVAGCIIIKRIDVKVCLNPEDSRKDKIREFLLIYLSTIIISSICYFGFYVLDEIISLEKSPFDFYHYNGDLEHDTMLIEIDRCCENMYATMRAYIMLVIGIVTTSIRFKTIKSKIIGFILNPLVYCPLLWHWFIWLFSYGFKDGLYIGG